MNGRGYQRSGRRVWRSLPGRMPLWLLAALTVLHGCASFSAAPIDEFESQITYHDMLALTDKERRIDKHIVKKVRSSAKSTFPSQKGLKVYAHNGIVLLLGTLPTDEDITRLGKVTAEIAQVKRVHNYVEREDQLRFSLNDSDNWAHLQIRLALSQLPDRLQTRTRLAVYDGVVYVMGIIYEREKPLLHSAVSQFTQVRKLVLLTEIID